MRLLNNWERNRTWPALRMLPRIISFLGYAPYDASWNLAQRLKAIREAVGLSQARLASILGVDEGTVTQWELGRAQPSSRSRQRLETFLGTLR